MKGLLWLLGSVLVTAIGYADTPAEGSDSHDGAAFETIVLEVESLRKKGLYEAALVRAGECLALADAAGAREWAAEALYQMAILHYLQDGYEEAVAYLEIALSTVRLHGDVAKEADLLNLQGNLHWKLGQFERATETLQRALDLFASIGKYLSMASAANNLGNVHASADQHAKALEFFRQGLKWANEVPAEQSLRMRASLLSNIGESLVALGKPDQAEPFLLESLSAELELNEPRDLAFSFASLGNLYAATGDHPRSREFHQKALEIQLQLDDRWAATLTRLRLAEALLRNSEPETALRILKEGFDDAKRLRSDALMQEYTELFHLAFTSSGDDAIAAYYGDLSAWFKERHERDNRLEPDTNANMSPANPVPPDQRAQSMAIARWVTIGVLGLVIVLLFIENGRLRRLTRDFP